jgi:ribonucleoside-diphosphate reductase alpha chain
LKIEEEHMKNEIQSLGDQVRDLVTPFGPIAQDWWAHKYQHEEYDRDYADTAARVAYSVMQRVGEDPLPYAQAIAARKFMTGGRYFYAAGRSLHQTQNCLLMRADDSREGWSNLLHKAAMALMTGAGIGVVYSNVRHEGAPIKRTGGLATGPVSLAKIVNEAGRGIMQGGSRRSAIWAGLHWWHPDALKFIESKNWSPEVRGLKEKDFNFPAALDGTNISIILDDAFFYVLEHPHEQVALDLPGSYYNGYFVGATQARQVYDAVVKAMLKTAEPGFSVDVGVNAGECLRNACTEVTSRDDSDICNLGSIVLPRVEDLDEMRYLTELGTKLLLAGTEYSHVPYSEVERIREKNRRLGLGIMGVAEWLYARGKKYEPDAELEKYLVEYARSTNFAHHWADAWGLSRPVKTRAMAPNGTIGGVAETTTCLEPIYSVAQKRRYMKHQTWFYQYTVDPTAKRLIDRGVNPDDIEDAYSIEPERRIAFQAWFQQYVDHGISSTINLPAWGSAANNESKVHAFGEMLLKYLPKLRGITCYPDGARGGQPLTPVKYATALKNGGEVYQEDICDLTKGGSCGD